MITIIGNLEEVKAALRAEGITATNIPNVRQFSVSHGNNRVDVTRTDINEYAELIYSTPDKWGSQTVYADEATMQDVIASLIDAGGEDWNEINLSDCTKWELVQVVNDIGIYQEQHVRRDNFVALKMADNGEYTEQEAFTSLDDAVEELSE